MEGSIMTLGGGGFSMSEDGSSLLDDHLLSLAGGDRPRVCFVPTASGDDSGYVQRFLDAFDGRAEPTVLSLFGKEPWGYADPAVVLDQDVVYVGGGSTANLLVVWRLHGLDRLLPRAAAGGTVLAGISAGMNCWFEGSTTDSFGPLRALPDGLGLLPGSACPHYLGETERRAAYHRMVGVGELPDGYAADDGVALVWRDGSLVEVVSERPDGLAVRVERTPDGVVETPLPVRAL
jgi:dipeptidase E